MAVFPDITCDWGMTEDILDGVELRESESGKLYARDNWGQTKRQWSLPFSSLSTTDEQTIREFYEARMGRAETFYFFHPFSSMKYSDQAVDETPNGVLNTFTIPGHTCTSVTVYIDDVEESAANYTLSAGTGTNGEDQIVFDGGQEPALGEVVTVNFTGRKRFLARFNSELRSSLDMYHSFELSLIEDFG